MKSQRQTTSSKRPHDNEVSQPPRKKRSGGGRYPYVTARHEENGTFTIWEGKTNLTDKLVAEKNACETLFDMKMPGDIITTLMARFLGRYSIAALAKNDNGRTITNYQALKALKASSGEPLITDEDFNVFTNKILSRQMINSLIDHAEKLSNKGIATKVIFDMHSKYSFDNIKNQAARENKPIEDVMIEWAKNKESAPIRKPIAANHKESEKKEQTTRSKRPRNQVESQPAIKKRRGRNIYPFVTARLEENGTFTLWEDKTDVTDKLEAEKNACETLLGLEMPGDVISTLMARFLGRQTIAALARNDNGRTITNYQALKALKASSSEPLVTDDNIKLLICRELFRDRINSILHHAENLSNKGIATSTILRMHSVYIFKKLKNQAATEKRPIEDVMFDWAKEKESAPVRAPIAAHLEESGVIEVHHVNAEPTPVTTPIAIHLEESGVIEVHHVTAAARNEPFISGGSTGIRNAAVLFREPEGDVNNRNRQHVDTRDALEILQTAGMTVPVMRKILSRINGQGMISVLAAPAEGQGVSNIQALFALRDILSAPMVTNKNIGDIATISHIVPRIKSLVRNAESLNQDGITTPVILAAHSSDHFENVMNAAHAALHTGLYTKEEEDTAILHALHAEIDTIAPGMRIEPFLPEQHSEEPYLPSPISPFSHMPGQGMTALPRASSWGELFSSQTLTDSYRMLLRTPSPSGRGR